jgi:hypothetical protein
MYFHYFHQLIVDILDCYHVGSIVKQSDEGSQ